MAMDGSSIHLNNPPPKRLAIFLDGTWNVVENNTNVWRLHSLCARRSLEVEQVTYYSTGVGTTAGEKLRGGLLGFGINNQIIKAYEWLVQSYNNRDEIFLFGFSRGAYAARSLGGFIAKCGVLRPGSPIGVGELFARYKQGSQARTLYQLIDAKGKDQLGETSILERWMLKHSIEAPIKMIGVWDTVGALQGSYGFLETGLRQSIESAYHALALDEHRARFQPTFYTRNFHLDRPVEQQPRPRGLANVEQRWFVGSHANVGGGYNSDLLAQVSLNWMLEKASGKGLIFRETVKDDEDIYQAPVNDSFKEFAFGAYYLLKRRHAYYRSIGMPDIEIGQVRTIVSNETIDSTVFERWRRDQCYRPQNLIDWAKRYNVDPGSIKRSVMAKDPRVLVQ